MSEQSVSTHPCVTWRWGRRGCVGTAVPPDERPRALCWGRGGHDCEVCSCWTEVNKKKGTRCCSWRKEKRTLPLFGLAWKLALLIHAVNGQDFEVKFVCDTVNEWVCALGACARGKALYENKSLVVLPFVSYWLLWKLKMLVKQQIKALHTTKRNKALHMAFFFASLHFIERNSRFIQVNGCGLWC